MHDEDWRAEVVNIHQILGQLETLTQNYPDKLSANKFHDFLVKEANEKYDPKKIVLPEYCQELHEKAPEILFRGYPGFGEFSTTKLIVQLLWDRFHYNFPFTVPDFLKPDVRLAPEFTIYYKFLKMIMDSNEALRYADFGRFEYEYTGPRTINDALLEGMHKPIINGRIGPIFITNRRVILMGPRLAKLNNQMNIERRIVYEPNEPYLTGVDWFYNHKIDRLSIDTGHLGNFFQISIKDVPVTETAIMYTTRFGSSIDMPEFKQDFKMMNLKITIILQKIPKQKKEVLRERYQKFEQSV
jgi:hypothetical protein